MRLIFKKTIYLFLVVLLTSCLQEVPPIEENLDTPPVTEMPSPTPPPISPIMLPAAPVISSAKHEGENFRILFSQPAGSLIPAGGYDTHVNGDDKDDNAIYSNYSRLVYNLDQSQKQCFRLEARYTQLSPAQYLVSNEVCVEGVIPELMAQAAVISEVKKEGSNSYRILFSQPDGSLVPTGGYDTFINGVDQNDNASYSNYSRLIPDLDTTQKQCFKFESRYAQLTPSQFIQSNEVCIDGVAAPSPPPVPEDNSGPLLAFPSAKGFGRNTTGGRGGRVIKVTNLNDSGSGSLREAVTAKGKRIVVFDVGGEIKLNSDLNINVGSEDLTIAGETAPSPGISVRNYGFDIHASNIIMRYITVRVGGESFKKSSTERDAIRIRNWGANGYILSNVIIDHCSVSWATDENMSIQGFNKSANTNNITVQNTLISEAGISSRYGMLIGSYVYRISILNNYFANNPDRNPLVGYGVADETIELIGNLIYGHSGTTIAYGNHIDVIGNHYRMYANQLNSANIIGYGANRTNNPNASESDGDIFVADNTISNPYRYSFLAPTIRAYAESSRVITNSTITSWPKNKSEVEEAVIGNKVGNSIFYDSVDTRQINDYKNNKGSYLSGAIHSSGWPNKPLTKRPGSFDTDNDGMSDAWELARWSNLTQDADGDDDNDGYTNIEEYFHSIAN